MPSKPVWIMPIPFGSGSWDKTDRRENLCTSFLPHLPYVKKSNESEILSEEEGSQMDRKEGIEEEKESGMVVYQWSQHLEGEEGAL